MEIRALHEGDLDAADRVLRRAFAALVGEDRQRDTDLVRTRWSAPHVVAFGAFDPGLVGTVFATGWGSVGFVGPLSVEPALWGRGIGSALFATADRALADVAHRGLFTFANSPAHHRLYQRFGYWPRFLTALMSRPVEPARPGVAWSLGSTVDRAELDAGARRLADAVFAGLDVRGEIATVLDQKIGDVVLLGPVRDPAGLAVLHDGPGSEAGSGLAYAKVALARPGAGADFARLVDACLGHAAAIGVDRLVVGVSTARRRAYRHLCERGFVTDVPGVTMHSPDTPGYDHDSTYVLDDWR